MFAIVDTETTGGNPVKDRIMEIAVIIHDGEKVVEEFHTLVNPETSISPFIIALTGISNEMVEDAPTFEQFAEQILQLTDKNIFVAHNARFDYAVVRREFRRLGIRFQQKQLCTVHLSQKLLPGHNSYSLGNICKDMGIEIEERHRAFGDAQATVRLFELLMKHDKAELINSVFMDELVNADLPLRLKETIDDLPEETGVYYFLDADLKIMHIGKGRNIRKRVIDQLVKDTTGLYGTKSFQAKIFDINYEITGSELVSQLLEYQEIRKHKPTYNATRKRKYRFGIYHYYDDAGYINLKVDKINEREQNALIEAVSSVGARKIMRRLVDRYELNPAFCGLNGHPKISKLNPEEYNSRANRLLKRYKYKHPNFFIIGEGRSHHEQSVVWVEGGQYQGFGFFEPENIENDIESLKDCVHRYSSSSEVQRIVRNWLRKKNRDEIIQY